MILGVIIGWIILSFIVASLGNDKKIGFVGLYNNKPHFSSYVGNTVSLNLLKMGIDWKIPLKMDKN